MKPNRSSFVSANDNRDDTNNNNDDDSYGSTGFSSPPCYMHELDPTGTCFVSETQKRDVNRWRAAERQRLLAARQALSADFRAIHIQALVHELDQIVAGIGASLVSLYWPFRGEPDLRAWMTAGRKKGLRFALPVVAGSDRPLVFREWHAGIPLARGVWSIPYPAEGDPVIPDVVVAPLVGFDNAGFRLGYGGGYFDRTLAALPTPSLAIGVGYTTCEIPTIYPQPHDIPMDWIALGDGRPRAYLHLRHQL